MSPTSEDEDSLHAKDSGNKPEEEAAVADATQKQAAKRRTKTGCLTCRKRRIKCGEEKPVCKNCIKSKRECAGYAQPLPYKQQNQGHPSALHDSDDQLLSHHDQSVTPGGFFGLPGPPDQQYYGQHHGFDPAIPSPFQQPPYGANYTGFPLAPHNDLTYVNASRTGGSYGWQNIQHPPGQSYPGMTDGTGRIGPGYPTFHDQNEPNHAFPLDPQLIDPSIYRSSHPVSAQSSVPPSSAFPPDDYSFQQERPHLEQFHQRSSTLSQPQSGLPIHIDENVARQFFAHAPSQHSVPQPPSLPTAPYTQNQSRDGDDDDDDDEDDPDDPYDVEMGESGLSFQDAADNLTEMLDRSGQRSWQSSTKYPQRWSHSRSVATFRPAMTLSPLRDERNERAFCHFAEVTSHCISIYERHHFSPISAPARTLWNFTIPALAFSHPALAHAILAVGALHLAKLNNTSEDPAIKHFTYAVRRVGKLLGLPKRRHEIATLATILILGFYEVLSGDHSRWNLHLSGATGLVLEHDFAALARTARRMRNGAKARINQWTAQFALTEENYARVAGIPLVLLDDIDWEVDTALVSRLTGIRVDYDHQFQPNFTSTQISADLTEKDIDDFKMKMDLRWYYCKQDIFQSMVSGDPLLMPYKNWVYCPPRGQIGRADNPYATLDHLLLVMGRLTEFGGKDRVRKQRAVAAQGGQWKPPKWLFGPRGPPAGPPEGASKSSSGPPKQSPSPSSERSGASIRSASQSTAKSSPAPSANEGRVRSSKPGLQGPGPGPGAGPPMFGMMPPATEPLQLHSAIQSMEASIRDPAFAVMQQRKESTPPRNLEDDTAKAFAEYNEIQKAFDVFERSLGHDFEPLPASGAPIATPFGPALVYKNPAVACIWGFYNIGRILLQRLHPEMPPAAMVSAGVTAHLTRDYAQTVGKICAGIYSTQQYGQSGALDPIFAGAMMESTFYLLFAGVQYTDPGQRGWTISKLKDIERRCGWQTSGAIAAACEIAWERMGQAGRGPPYERVWDVNNKDIRVSGVFRRSEGKGERSSQVSDAATEHEIEFVNHDRSLIDRSGSTRVHWAMGLLSVEEDIKQMSLEDE